jgi:hypothetical protein
MVSGDMANAKLTACPDHTLSTCWTEKSADGDAGASARHMTSAASGDFTRASFARGEVFARRAVCPGKKAACKQFLAIPGTF